MTEDRLFPEKTLPAPLPEGIDISTVPGAISAAVLANQRREAELERAGIYPRTEPPTSTYADLGGQPGAPSLPGI